MKHGHQVHSYPGDKMIPVEVLEDLKEGKIGNKLIKHCHTKKCRSYNKNLCRNYNGGE